MANEKEYCILSLSRQSPLSEFAEVEGRAPSSLCNKESEMDEILSRVSKPARYLGNEPGTVLPKAHAKVRWVMAFPDVYEIGMSHLGLKILYGILNEIPDVSCERAFAPWVDFEDQLRLKGCPLTSLESKSPLHSFDILGFSLQHEMLYSNVLNMLELSHLPLLSKDRDDTHPLVVGGGPCAVNPEPLADFFDAFLIGDGENGIVHITNIVRQYKGNRLSRQETLLALAMLEGVYVPSLYEPQWNEQGEFLGLQSRESSIPQTVTARKESLNGLFYPVCQVMPILSAVHDRASVEIRRGCTRGCRFCQAGFLARPVRERNVEEIVKLCLETSLKTGYDEVSLLSLSSGDYSQIRSLMVSLNNLKRKRRMHVAVPSLRLDRMDPDFLQSLSGVRQKSLTFAPEAGSQRLRNVINKDLTNDEIFATIKNCYNMGWKTVKLYFMVGLPGETDQDIQAIIDMVNEIRRFLSSGTRERRKRQLHISIAPFVPKPHTPFQWTPQLSVEELQRRAEFVAKTLRRAGIKVHWHDVNKSFLEAVFARGDRHLSSVLLKARDLGVRMDDWTDHFHFDLWLQAFQAMGIDPAYYAARERREEEKFAWDFVDVGVRKSFLWKELRKSQAEEVTSDCSLTHCIGCGACSKRLGIEVAAPVNVAPLGPAVKQEGVKESHVELPYWYRVQFTKPEMLRFLSHLEMLRVITQILYRSQLPIRMSRGFHPQARLSFGFALALGLTSKAEFVDIAMDQAISEKTVLSSLRTSVNTMFEVIAVRYVGRRKGSLVNQTRRIVYQLSLKQLPVRVHLKAVQEARDKMREWENSGRNEKKMPGCKLENVDMLNTVDMIYFLPSEGQALRIEVVVQARKGRTPKPVRIVDWLISKDGRLSEKLRVEKVAALGELSDTGFVSLLEVPVGDRASRTSGQPT